MSCYRYIYIYFAFTVNCTFHPNIDFNNNNIINNNCHQVKRAALQEMVDYVNNNHDVIIEPCLGEAWSSAEDGWAR